jgi:hypothetical protein
LRRGIYRHEEPDSRGLYDILHDVLYAGVWTEPLYKVIQRANAPPAVILIVGALAARSGAAGAQ